MKIKNRPCINRFKIGTNSNESIYYQAYELHESNMKGLTTSR